MPTSASSAAQMGYRGRVRSGCLTCRSRKVRCDELRPICRNCTRLKRSCVYKPRKTRQYPPSLVLEQTTSDESGGSAGLETASQPYPSPSSEEHEEIHAGGIENPIETSVNSNIAGDAAKNPFLSPDSSIVDITARLEKALRRQDGTSDDAEPESESLSVLNRVTLNSRRQSTSWLPAKCLLRSRLRSSLSRWIALR